MKRLTKEVFEAIVDAVTYKTRHMRTDGSEISGFMFVADLITKTAMFTLINRDTPLRIGVPGKKDANFAAVAGAKFGKVFAHKKNSGGASEIYGELEHMGGRISADEEHIYVFSGGTAEEDDELMQTAELAHTHASRTGSES